MSSVAKVNVEVLKIPENSKHPPEIQNPNLKVDITETDTVGYTVALIMAVDKDQDYLWYKIESKLTTVFYPISFILPAFISLHCRIFNIQTNVISN